MTIGDQGDGPSHMKDSLLPNTANTTLLAKWVRGIMQQSGDLAVVVLQGRYGASIDWSFWSTPRRGDSAFMQGLRLVFTCMQSLFRPHVGDGASFIFWKVEWSSHKRFRAIYPRLHGLALDLEATMRTVWDANWFPSLPSTLSDQRYTDLLALHTALVPVQLSGRARRLGVVQWALLRLRCLPSHSRLREYLGLAYAP